MPRGWVEITFERLELDVGALGLANFDAEHRLYAIAEVGPHDAGDDGRLLLGRSRRIHVAQGSVDDQGHFDFATERMVWSHAVRAADAEAVDLRMTLWLDRLDAAPQQQLQWVVAVAAPWHAGVREVAEGPHTLRYRVASVVEQVGPPVLNLALDDVDDPVENVQHVDEQAQAVVDITGVTGLFRPVTGLDPAQSALGTPLHNALLSEAIDGYLSADHKGRIFINRLPDDTWTGRTQYIDLSAEVFVRGLTAEQRDQLQIKWTIIIPDDPSNDVPTVHREAGAILDPSDYQAGEHIGSRGYDNEGTNTEYTQNNHAWEQSGNFALTVGNAEDPIGLPAQEQPNAANQVYLRPALTDTEAVDNQGPVFRRCSEVRLHCPNIRGDRLMVRVTVEGQDYRVLPAQTGLMTMWNRIDLEYRRMQTAFHLPVASLPGSFEPLFVQMDVHAQANIVDIDRILSGQIAGFLDQDTTFANRAVAGWLSLIAIKLLGAPPAANVVDHFEGERLLRWADAGDETMHDLQQPPNYDDHTDRNRFEYIDVPGQVPQSPTVRMTWDDAQGVPRGVKFSLCRREHFELEAHRSLNGIRQRLRLLGLEPHAFDSNLMVVQQEDQQAINALKQRYANFDAAYTQAPANNRARVTRRWLAWILQQFEANQQFPPGNANPSAQEVRDAEALDVTRFSRLWFRPHDVQNDFTAGDGSQSHAYTNRLLFGPRRTETITAGQSQGTAPGGYGIPDVVQVRVSSKSGELKGQSPGTNLQNDSYFSGRTLVATHHSSYNNQGQPVQGYAEDVAIAVVHELVHAFGMPHKCAAWDVDLPRQHTCCMNYTPNWMVDGANALVPDTANLIGAGMCAHHIKQVRRVHLEDNVALQDRGWQ